MKALRGAGSLARGGRCTWSLEEGCLLVSPEAGTPVALDLGLVRALSGDGYTLRLDAENAQVELSRLGAGGATLLDELWRSWPFARARALRLLDDAEGEPLAGTLDRGSGPVPCRFLLCEGALLAAPEGGDLAPLFLPLLDAVRFDPDAYAWRLEAEGERPWTLARLAGRTERFGEALTARREALATEGGSALAATLPTVARTALAGMWPPGRFRTITSLETLAPGIGKAVQGATTRKAEAALILAAAEPRLALARPGWGGDAGAETPPVEEGADAGTEASAEIAEGAYPLWALARLSAGWVLEALNEGGHATYVFSGGDEVPGLVSRLFCAPHLPLAALYLPEASLKPEHSVPVRELPFLRDLRARFTRRIIHNGHAPWRRALGFG